MAIKRKITIVMLIFATAIGIFAQGLAITVVMQKVEQKLDTKYFAGRFYWKPKLPPLYRSAKAGIVPKNDRKLNFSSPFSNALKGN